MWIIWDMDRGLSVLFERDVDGSIDLSAGLFLPLSFSLSLMIYDLWFELHTYIHTYYTFHIPPYFLSTRQASEIFTCIPITSVWKG